MQQMDEIILSGISALQEASNLYALEQVKVNYLGKNGLLTTALKRIGQLPISDRQAYGTAVNLAKQQFLASYHSCKNQLTMQLVQSQSLTEPWDVTLPGRGQASGGLHPITLTLERIIDLFSSVGFIVADGPEIEDDFHNFQALNIPPNHPARAMHDTFYITDEKLLRTHTSSVQVRYMRSHQPPIKIIAPGRVYRVDSDATHSPMFHQVEGLWIDQCANFAELKAIMIDFLRRFFDREDLKVRFRASFFAFTEPSAEIDVWGEKGWLEVAGCGMVHPNVLQNVGIDPTQYQGWAFGIGLDRFAMLRYGVNDLRLFFENDLDFLAQFC
ncbi:MAG: phenylalanine--tRNA ligase subunit alpha [Neisseriales bacterium]|nr:MAG: phenylalanine--tRNA ligase subunit alpha [Neisseriales bacterium]